VTTWSQPSMFEAGAESDSAPATGAPALEVPRNTPRTLQVLRGDLFYFDPRTGQTWREPDLFEDLEP
jgi:hypothetical protein